MGCQNSVRPRGTSDLGQNANFGTPHRVRAHAYDLIAVAFDVIAATVTVPRIRLYVSVPVDFDQALVADPEVVGDLMEDNPSDLPA